MRPPMGLFLFKNKKGTVTQTVKWHSAVSNGGVHPSQERSTQNEERLQRKTCKRRRRGITKKRVPQICIEHWISFNPLRPESDLSQTSHCNIKGISVSGVMRIENMIAQVKFY